MGAYTFYIRFLSLTGKQMIYIYAYQNGLIYARFIIRNYRVVISVCLCVCVSVYVHDNSKNNGSIHLKLEHIVIYENRSDEFNIGHCPIKVKVMA